MKDRLFTKEERGTFLYWFYHWKAFNRVAFKLSVWRFKYLFHDIEKPFLMLLWKDYKKVQEFHRKHNKHHIEYPGQVDMLAHIIDCECSRFTKKDSPLTARETIAIEYRNGKIDEFDYNLYVLIMDFLKLN